MKFVVYSIFKIAFFPLSLFVFPLIWEKDKERQLTISRCIALVAFDIRLCFSVSHWDKPKVSDSHGNAGSP